MPKDFRIECETFLKSLWNKFSHEELERVHALAHQAYGTEHNRLLILESHKCHLNAEMVSCGYGAHKMRCKICGHEWHNWHKEHDDRRFE